jgi:integrase
MKANQLSDRKISTTKKPGYQCDGGGLYLQVSQYGSKNWVFRFKSPELLRDREMGLGNLDTWSLAEARERARECRQAVSLGVDPIEERRRKRDQVRATLAERVLFKDAVDDFLSLHNGEWKNDKHRKQWRSTLEAYAFQKLGSRPVGEIDAALINEALAPIWTTIPETARRTKNRIERVCQWVKDGKPLPQRGASKRIKHHAAIPVAELPAFMAELRKRDSIYARALEFCILTAARTSETLNATWDEIDLKAGVWTIPATRMKVDKEHTVPLSNRALAIFKGLPRVGEHVFTASPDGAPLGHSALLELLRGMDGNGYTVHGFRSAFRDWAGDKTHFPRDVIEFALAHKVKDKIEAAYRRSSALEKRRKLMETWASYCERPASSGKVVSLHDAA